MAQRSRSNSSDSDSGSSDGAFRQKKPQEQIPDAVDHFLGCLSRALKERSVSEVHKLYEGEFNKLADKHYKGQRWPSVEAVEDQISDEPFFIILYKELYFRHIYSRLQVTFEDRRGSWMNYCQLMDLLISDMEEHREPRAALPAQWTWDIFDEFIYHYQTCCAYRIKAAKRGGEEMEAVKAAPDIFCTMKVLKYLHDLIKHSRIQEYLVSDYSVGRVGSFVNEGVRLMGYFCVMQLLRVQVILGDYHLAMKTIACIDFHEEVPLFYKIPGCHITLYYYMGFSYLMLRRYADAFKTFSDVLVFLSKTSGVNSLSYQFSEMMKKQEQMYSLLLMCVALCPQPLDESLDKTIKEKYAEKQARLQRGEELSYEELFSYACPKFVSPAPPDFERLDLLQANEAHQRQLRLFLSEVKQQQSLPTIGSYMKLYSAITTNKLAQLCETDEAGLRDQLMCVMHKTRQLVNAGQDVRAPLAGTMQACSEVDFYLDGNMIHINSHKPQRQASEVFLEHIGKFQEILKKLEAPKDA